MVGAAEKEEKKWLGLYVSTTQYRKDNLLLSIKVTRSVFQFETSELKSLALLNTAKPKTSSSSMPIIIHQNINRKEINNNKKDEEKKWLDFMFIEHNIGKTTYNHSFSRLAKCSNSTNLN